ncbi:MAG: hypothetical protein KDC02_13900, partial [Flavobacteriales bacterium]|nr:hypothetical protein [Flavobacteriales bacterium]
MIHILTRIEQHMSRSLISSMLLLGIPLVGVSQIYLHDFGNTTITAHPYTVAPGTLDAGLSNSSWSNSNSAWTSFAGSSGQAISLNSSGGTPVITLTFDVASGYEAEITSFDFWRRRSPTGAQNWSMTINSIAVGSGTVPTTGAAIGVTSVANPVSGLTGTVTIELSLSGATGTGTFRLDDFTLNGSVVLSASQTVLEFDTPVSATVAENVGTTDLTLTIANPDGSNASSVDVVLLSGAAARINNYTTQTINWAAGDGTDKTLTITVTDNSACDGDEVLVFELQNASGGNSATVGAEDQFTLTVQDNDLCTGVQFAGTDLTVSETAGTADLTLSITDPSGSQATSVDVVLISGDPARINNYTTQTVSWVAGDGTDKALTLTLTDDLDCLGDEDLVFELQNLTGGQGTPFIGSPSQRSVTVTDNEFANGVVIARQGFEGSGAD